MATRCGKKPPPKRKDKKPKAGSPRTAGFFRGPIVKIIFDIAGGRRPRLFGPGEGQAQHHRDADGQGRRDLDGVGGAGSHLQVVVLDEIVGGVVDAGARHQREDAGQQEHRHRGLEGDGENPGQQSQRDGRQQVGGDGADAQHHRQLIGHPAHGAGGGAGQVALAGDPEQDAEGEGSDAAQQQLPQQIQHLCSCHATVTPVSSV